MEHIGSAVLWSSNSEGSAIALSHRCNEQIRISPVRLVDEANNALGIVPTDEALRRARESGMDLVEVAPTERPPVCRIMDYGKFKYSQKKKKQKHREQKLKEIRLHPDVGDNDAKIKMVKALEFLDEGDKVQFTIVFRGRERFHQDLGMNLFRNILEQLKDKVKVERPPMGEGKRLIMVLSPLKH